MKEVTISEMLKAGVHFGHKSAKWNPKMKPFIYQSREKVHIIDIRQTKERLTTALEFISDVAKKGGKILFIGTKKQAKEIIRKEGQAAKMPYVADRWLGGSFTNFDIIKKRISRMLEMEKMEASDEFDKYTKKEQIKYRKELEKLQKNVGGLRTLEKLPEAIFVLDMVDSKSIIKEATEKNIPIVSLVDTNGDPEAVNYPIPSNDDAISAIELMVGVVSKTIQEANPSAYVKEPVKTEKK